MGVFVFNNLKFILMASNIKQQKIYLPIKGMHCRSCEMLVEEHLSQIPEVTRSQASVARAGVDIFYHEQKPNDHEVAEAIRAAGYEIGVAKPKTWFNHNLSDYQDLGAAFFIFILAYLALKNFGILNFGASLASSSFSLPVVLLVGLTAGFSTCMALVGGIVLGIATRHAEAHPEASPWQKFRPHLYFNLGRVAGYAFLGGLLGLVGSALQLSNTATGILTVAVGAVMLIVGLQLVDVFPWLTNWKFTLPKSVSRLFGIKHHIQEYNHKQAAMTGALTFFLPCGFTQAMQLYAISSGSFVSGALIMGIFSLGTAPGLLSVGGITSIVKGVFAKRFFKFAGLVVVALALFNFANGSRLLGWNFNSPVNAAQNKTAAADPNVTLENGAQVVRMTEGNSGYSPRSFTIQKGIPVRWLINAQAPYSCASSLVVPSLNLRFNLKPGQNVVEFTPTQAGRINFSCSMGMYTGSFNVVEPGAKSSAVNPDNSFTLQTVPGSACGSSGGCGCGGRRPSPPTPSPAASAGEGREAETPLSENDSRNVDDSQGTQVIKTTYTYDADIEPNSFVVQAGKPVKLEIDVKENGYGCMSTIVVPGLYEEPEYLQAGKIIVMNFTPQKTGDYPITCAMGVPRGIIKVQ
ncbi:MAG: hypothetical protein AUJ72_05520 [Candidatus Omnitrophica bacterium CG1_02_46_14]|nr:MAG: hypothetical protein AUJ72_05520 [Candidatus Omnitrophica bacterium CG1_02_46_14]